MQASALDASASSKAHTFIFRMSRKEMTSSLFPNATVFPSGLHVTLRFAPVPFMVSMHLLARVSQILPCVRMGRHATAAVGRESVRHSYTSANQVCPP